jgi:phosphatidylinositol phospholipase C gamma-1
MDLRNTVKNGILYLEDPVDKEWNPHFFVLTQHKLFYTDSFQNDQEPEGDEEEEESGFHRSKEVKIHISQRSVLLRTLHSQQN